MQRSSAFRPASTDNEYGGDRKCFFRSVHEDHQARAGGRLFFNIQPGKHKAREVDETAEGRREERGEIAAREQGTQRY